MLGHATTPRPCDGDKLARSTLPASADMTRPDQSLEAGEQGKKRRGCGEAAATTMVLRNLPAPVTCPALVQELDMDGFEGKYDFSYVPSDFTTGLSHGFAFVNFRCPRVARDFALAWNGSRRFCAELDEAPLNITTAKVQGLDANLVKWSTRRMRRVKNKAHLPFIASEGQGTKMSEGH